MASNWEYGSSLAKQLLKHDLINCMLEIIQCNGNCVQGVLKHYVLDRNCIFLTLHSVLINEDTLPETMVIGMDIVKWRVLRYPEQKLIVERKPNISLNIVNDLSKIYIDKSVLCKQKNPFEELTFSYKEINVNHNADCAEVDLCQLKLSATNQIELVKYNPIGTSDELEQYYQRCLLIRDLLQAEHVIGMAMFPNNEDNRAKLKQINKMSVEQFLNSLNIVVIYLCFSTGNCIYAFRIINHDTISDRINQKLFDYLKPVIESKQTQKVIHQCSILSGLLSHKYEIRLANICDLYCLNQQIQYIQHTHHFYQKKNSNQKTFSFEQMVENYLDISIKPLTEVKCWLNYTSLHANTICLHMVYLRELSAQMGYQMYQYLYTYSNRCLVTLRDAANTERQLLSKLAPNVYYEKLLSQPLFQHEKLMTNIDIRLYFPIKYFDINEFLSN